MFELLFRVQDKTQPDLSLGKRDFGDQVQIILRQKHLQSEVGATSIKTQSIQFDVPRIRVFNQAASLGNPLFFPGTIVHLDRKWESENSSFAEYRPPNFLGKSAFVFICQLFS